jgi:hypothetical protein
MRRAIKKPGYACAPGLEIRLISLAGFITRPQADIKSARWIGAQVTRAKARCQIAAEAARVKKTMLPTRERGGAVSCSTA